MFHQWLGPNGLPLSPRKQKAMLFQFCTSNFVTEAEMRYCYARMLAVGNPSGPVKFEGQPQYDSEQIVAPLFSFAPPAEGDGEEAPEAPAAARAPEVSLVQENKRAAAAATKSDAAVAAVAAAAQVAEQKKELAREAAKLRNAEMVAAQKKVMLHAEAVERKEAAKLEREEDQAEQRAAARHGAREAEASNVARARTAAAKGQVHTPTAACQREELEEGGAMEGR